MRGRRRYRVPRRSRIPPSTSIAPVAQHRGGNAQLACDPAQRPTATHQQGYRFPLELIRKMTPSLAHSTPFRSRRSLAKVSTNSRESHLMNEGGQTADTADEWVASRLDKAGYKKPRRAGSRQDGRLITRNTVKAWRKEAREAAHGNLMRNTYDGLIDTSSERWFTEPPFDRDDPPTEKAQQIMSTL